MVDVDGEWDDQCDTPDTPETCYVTRKFSLVIPLLGNCVTVYYANILSLLLMQVWPARL